ncbi:MATE family efflux transporter [Altererythrobacter endophyticus]|uniref:MATE family efflux transporter n=2 Tax=Altericroceibacterium endophyticum TaxID=1808508 RepID=A0A6I4T3R7_9SPHN|nr:MATE family efflux transporter [Altericroceibacterium endophyticum]
MAFVMGMGGLLNVVDAAFLGHYVGATALAAVSFSFPGVMVLIAFGSLVGGGMSSIFARHLGAGDRTFAAAIFASAHGLCLLVSFGLAATFFIAGPLLLEGLAKENAEMAELASTYLLILVAGAPIQFLMNLHADAARSEGRAGFMAVLSVGVTGANIVLNYALIVGLHLGVAGSAWGTLIAQALGLLLLLELRRRDALLLPLSSLRRFAWWGNWRAILALGLPLSLSFIGMALVSAVVIAAVNWSGGADYAATIAAYGIVTRILGFAFMPLMALALATQTIVGTNSGAGLHTRSNHALICALALAFGYCLLLELALLAVSGSLGFSFVDDAQVVSRVGLIIRPMLTFYLFSGPVLVLAMYFQAIGQPGRTAALMLLKPFILVPLAIFLFASFAKPMELWFAFPVADVVIMILATALFLRHVVAANHGENGIEHRKGAA